MNIDFNSDFSSFTIDGGNTGGSPDRSGSFSSSSNDFGGGAGRDEYVGHDFGRSHHDTSRHIDHVDHVMAGLGKNPFPATDRSPAQAIMEALGKIVEPIAASAVIKASTKACMTTTTTVGAVVGSKIPFVGAGAGAVGGKIVGEFVCKSDTLQAPGKKAHEKEAPEKKAPEKK
jgi:hypothetical protein